MATLEAIACGEKPDIRKINQVLDQMEFERERMDAWHVVAARVGRRRRYSASDRYQQDTVQRPGVSKYNVLEKV